MARILNVIHLPHLASYKAFEGSKYRCCTVCKYKVMIETDDGRILAASALNESELDDFDIDEAIKNLSDKEQNHDCFYAVDRFIVEDSFDCFVSGGIEEGEGAIRAFGNVVNNLRESRIYIHDEVKNKLRNLADDIEKLLNTNE